MIDYYFWNNKCLCLNDKTKLKDKFILVVVLRTYTKSIFW